MTARRGSTYVRDTYSTYPVAAAADWCEQNSTTILALTQTQRPGIGASRRLWPAQVTLLFRLFPPPPVTGADDAYSRVAFRDSTPLFVAR